jgi:cation transport ATPase
MNDAPALVQADAGIAVGTDIVMEAPDITLVQGNLKCVVTSYIFRVTV